jgi:hypothetical protein
MTGRPANIPARGDVPAGMVARLLGLASDEFDRLRAALEDRGFPAPDPTTGRYCIEAVDRWRLGRHVRLFPELTIPAGAAHAETVFRERMRSRGLG